MAENNDLKWIDDLFDSFKPANSKPAKPANNAAAPPNTAPVQQVKQKTVKLSPPSVIDKNYSTELNALLSAYLDYSGAPNHPKILDVRDWCKMEQGLINAVKSNQKYSNFDLATWEPWIYFGLSFLHDSGDKLDSQASLEKAAMCISDFYEDDDAWYPEDKAEIQPGKTFKDWVDSTDYDEYWYDTSVTVFPKNFKTVQFVSPDCGEFGCYDVLLLIDQDTDNIIWMAVNSD